MSFKAAQILKEMIVYDLAENINLKNHEVECLQQMAKAVLGYEKSSATDEEVIDVDVNKIVSQVMPLLHFSLGILDSLKNFNFTVTDIGFGDRYDYLNYAIPLATKGEKFKAFTQFLIDKSKS